MVSFDQVTPLGELSIRWTGDDATEVRLAAKPGDKQEAWLLFKKRDRHAKPRSEYDVVSALPDSVICG